LSLKQDIEMVKEELNSEEKFFEKAVITEKFVKKYKTAMIASVVAIVLIVGANFAYEMNQKNTKDAANATLLELEKNPQNTTALARLETLSPAMHDVWLYAQAIVNKDLETLKKLESSNTTLISDLATYESATESKDLKTLEDYALQQDAIYKDLATLQSAVVLMDEGKIEQAHEKLSQISIDSSLAAVSKALMHYGVK